MIVPVAEASPLRDALPPALREQHVADAVAELSRAERALDDALAPVAITRPPPSARPTSTAPPARTETAPPSLPGEPRAGCETACMALASMGRSSEYVCRLAGPGDERCRDARERVSRAAERVSRSACGCTPERG